MKRYDYLIIGAGLFGAVFAERMTRAGKKCLVIDRRSRIAGNVYTKEIEGILPLSTTSVMNRSPTIRGNCLTYLLT